jgi:hypothetical protein
LRADLAKVTLAACLVAIVLHAPSIAHAQAGPPFLTNDPGTPGNAHWEINLGVMPTFARGVSSYQIPQIDLNYGVGDRIQLTYEVPYIVQSASGQPVASGWSNGYPGVKWRFLDQGEDGWHMSVFPQFETGLSALAQAKGLGGAGPRFLLPFELQRTLGPLDVDFEAGTYFPEHGPKEHILGFAAGRSVTERLELDGEVYYDFADGGVPHAITLNLGGRYKLRQGLIGMFLVGRSLNGFSYGQPEFTSYLGVQILLSDYGRHFSSED